MIEESRCSFCHSSITVAEHCRNCAKFLDIVSQHQDYMLGLGKARIKTLQSFYQAKALAFEWILTKQKETR